MSTYATSVVTCFVTHGDRVLVLKRSKRVGTYRGAWAGVSGYLEAATALEQAWIELREELGLGREALSLIAEGSPFRVTDEHIDKVWLVHPFRFALQRSVEFELDWEHVEMQWIQPGKILELDTVPGLWDAWLKVST